MSEDDTFSILRKFLFPDMLEIIKEIDNKEMPEMSKKLLETDSKEHHHLFKKWYDKRRYACKMNGWTWEEFERACQLEENKKYLL